MKLLLDTCVWGGAKHELIAASHDVIWVGDWIEDPGDDEILERAHQDGRILVGTFKDFGDLAIMHGQPHAGIVRLVNFPARRQAAVCLYVLERYGTELTAGAIVTAEPGRLRFRPPETLE